MLEWKVSAVGFYAGRREEHEPCAAVVVTRGYGVGDLTFGCEAEAVISVGSHGAHRTDWRYV